MKPSKSKKGTNEFKLNVSIDRSEVMNICRILKDNEICTSARSAFEHNEWIQIDTKKAPTNTSMTTSPGAEQFGICFIVLGATTCQQLHLFEIKFWIEYLNDY